MKTPYCEWLNGLADLAAKENLAIEARYHDLLYFYHKMGLTFTDALERYKKFLVRWRALNPQEPVLVHTPKNEIDMLGRYILAFWIGALLCYILLSTGTET